MRRCTILLLLVIIAGSTGCLISTQIGDRTHVNAPRPDEITFHFDTTFNRGILFGRSAALALVALWAFFTLGKGNTRALGLLIGAAALAGAGWLLMDGWSKVFSYRIEVGRENLQLGIPSQPPQVIRWEEIEMIEGEGFARDVSFGDNTGRSIKWAPEWEELTITLTDGRKRLVDLRPLSVEQRGTFWRAIARKANLHVKEWVEQDKS